MNRRRLAQSVLFAILAATATAALAQNQADTLFNAAVNVQGASAIAGLQTIVVHGQSTPAGKGNAAPITITADVRGYLRVDYGTQRSIVTTPYRRFEIRNSKVFNEPPHLGAFAQFDMLGPVAFRQYQTAATQRTIQDPTTIQGRPAYHLSLNSGQSLDVDRTVIHDVADIYLDATAGLLLGVSRQSRANRIQVKYLSAFSFSDYRNVNGLLFPYQIQEYLNGNLQNTITVQGVELNAAVDPQLFRQ